MTWLTSLPTPVLVISGLVLALLAATGGRLAVRALVPAAEREGAHAIAAPLMPALGAIFALRQRLDTACAEITRLRTESRSLRDQLARQLGLHRTQPAIKAPAEPQ